MNSNTRREMAVTVALIMCGLAPARPPAIIVMNSSMLAAAEIYPHVKNQGNEQAQIGRTILSAIFLHPVNHAPLYDTSAAHLPSHRKDDIEGGSACFFRGLLGSKDSLGNERRDDVHRSRWQQPDERRQQAESVLSRLYERTAHVRYAPLYLLSCGSQPDSHLV